MSTHRRLRRRRIDRCGNQTGLDSILRTALGGSGAGNPSANQVAVPTGIANAVPHAAASGFTTGTTIGVDGRVSMSDPVAIFPRATYSQPARGAAVQ